MKVLLLNVYKNFVKEIEINDDLKEYYENLECNYIEIVERKIGNKWFDVICDEEGTFVDSPKISAIDNLGTPMFVGNLIFAHHDSEGNMTGLKEKESDYIRRRIQTMFTNNHPEGYLMLTQCEYR